MRAEGLELSEFHLAEFATRQGIRDFDVARHHERGHPRLGERMHLRWGDRFIGFSHDDQFDLVFSDFTGHCHGRAFQHGFVSGKDFFKLRSGNVLSATPNVVAEPSLEIEKTGIVHGAQVTRMEPV